MKVLAPQSGGSIKSLPRRGRVAAWLGALLVCAPGISAAQGTASASTRPPELVPQLGLPGLVNDLALSPDGRWLAVASTDGAHLVDVETGGVARTWRSNRIRASALAWSPGGGQLAFAEGMRIRLCDVESGADRSLEGHLHFVEDIGFTADGRWLVSSTRLGGNDAIRLWDVATGREARQLPGPKSLMHLAVSPDGRTYAYGAQGDSGGEATEDRALIVIEPLQTEAPAGGTTTRRFVGVRGLVSALAFSPDSRFLAAAVTDPGFTSGGRIHWIDLGSSKLESKLLGTSRRVDKLAFSQDGRWLAAATEAGVVVYETAQPRAVRIFREASATALAFGRDARYLWVALWGVGDLPPGVALLDVSSAREVRRLPVGTELRALALAGDRGLLATLHTQRETGLASRSRIGILDTGTGERKLREFAEGRLGRDERHIASQDLTSFVSVTSKELALWDAASGEKRRALSLPSVSVDRITTGGPGSPWLLQGQDSSYREPPGPSGWSILVDEALEKIVWQQQEPPSMSRRTGKLAAMSPDGKHLALGRDWSLELQDSATGKPIRKWSNDADVRALRFSRDGKRLASVGGPEHPLRVWDVESGEALHSWAPVEKGRETPERDLSLVAWHPDGARLATVSMVDSSVRIARLDGSTIHTLAGDGLRFDLAFGPDGRWLAARGGSAVYLWDTDTGAALATLYVSGVDEGWLVAGPEGTFDASPEAWDRASFLFEGKLLRFGESAAFFDRFRVPGLLSDLLTGKRPSPRDLSKLDGRQPELKLALGTKAPESALPAGPVRVSVEVAEAPPTKTRRAGSGAREVLLFANGAVVRAWPGEVLAPGAGRVVLETEVPLAPGENQLVAYAFNAQRVRGPAASLLVTAQPAAPVPVAAKPAQAPFPRRPFEPGGPETQVLIGTRSLGKVVGSPRRTGPDTFEVTQLTLCEIALFVDQAGARSAFERLGVPGFEVQDWELLLGDRAVKDVVLEGDFPKIAELEFVDQMKAKDLKQDLERGLGRTPGGTTAETAAFIKYLTGRDYRRGDKVVIRLAPGNSVLTNVGGQELPPLRGSAFVRGVAAWLFEEGRFGRVTDVFR